MAILIFNQITLHECKQNEVERGFICIENKIKRKLTTKILLSILIQRLFPTLILTYELV